MDRLLRRWRAKPLWFRDGPLALALTVLTVVDLGADGPVALLAVAGALSLAWRRTKPVAVLVITGLLFVVATAASGAGGDALAPALVAVYTVFTYYAPWIGVATAAIEAAWFCAALLLRGRDDAGTQAVAVVACFALAVTVALAVRGRRDLLDAARERARREERTRETEAALRVAEERLRIVRELHGGIGHQAAVVTVQAAVAEQLLFVEPSHAQAALEQVQDAGRTLLSGLSALVEVLREPDEDPPDQPQPGLALLDGLRESARAAGLEVTVTSAGEPRPLPPAADLAAYLVVQESLTNAREHGDGTAQVTMTYLPSTLVLESVNPVRPAAERKGPAAATVPGAAGSDSVEHRGFGLAGMRERVTSLGGTLHAGREPGPDGEQFVVRAVLPAATEAPVATEPDAVPESES